MRKHGGTPSRRDKYVTPAAISPPGAARGGFFDAWGLPAGEHYSKRPNHGQERSWRADVQSLGPLCWGPPARSGGM